MSQTKKKPVLLVVWLVLLGGLMYGISHFNAETAGGDTPSSQGRPKPPDAATLEKKWPQILAHAVAPPRGNPNAPYTMAEFGDFQCPQCAKVRPMLEKMMAQYPNQADLIFLHRPFQFHKWALPAAQASEIAAKQGKFWPMYDMLYSHQDDLEPGFYPDYAAKIGMNKAQFQKAFAANQGVAEVKAATAFADSIGVEETPTLLVRDNAHNTVTAYMGLEPKDPSTAPPNSHYIDRDFLRRLPWLTAPAGKAAQGRVPPSRKA